MAAWDAKYGPSGLAVSAYDAGAVLDRAIAAAGPSAGRGKIDSSRGEWEVGPGPRSGSGTCAKSAATAAPLSNAVNQDLVTLGS